MYTLARQQDTRQPFHRPFRRVFNSPCNDFELFPRLAPFLDRKDVRTKYYEPWQVECIYREAIEKGWSGLLVWNSDIVIGNSIIFPLLFLLSLPKTFFLETVNGWIKKVQKCKELNIQFLVFRIKIIVSFCKYSPFYPSTTIYVHLSIQTINSKYIRTTRKQLLPFAEGYRCLILATVNCAQSDLRVHLPRVVNGSSASRFINNERRWSGG